MKIYNTLTRQKETFKPLQEGKVSIYTCGPTVYARAHIGNLRKYIGDDILYRLMLAKNFQVTRIMNITDIDDKIIKAAGGNKAEMEKIVRKYEDLFWQDLKALNIAIPTEVTRATAYIEKMVAFIEDLISKGFAYKSNDGSVYFAIDKFKNYGKLSGLENREIKVGARVAQDEYSKENPSDFALWKAWSEADGEIYWETKPGKGRPGWHIECSTMAMDKLGETIDIHTGAVDNIFPHHENEIAQSEAKTGKPFVRYWVHNEHLLVDGGKMAKSLGNVYYLDDLIEKGFSPLDFRYLVLGCHYRDKLNFTWASLESAKNTLENISRLVSEKREGDPSRITHYASLITEAFEDDFNTPKVLALLHEAGDYKLWQKADQILGLGLTDIKEKQLTGEQKELLQKREELRKMGKFTEADEIRQKLVNQGIEVRDALTIDKP